MSKINSSRTWNRHGVKIVWALSILFLLLVIARLSIAANNMKNAKARDYAPQEIAAISRSSGPNYQVAEITSANLFGNPAPKKVVKNAPKTNLDLKLQGILWATDDQIARVIIQAGKKKAQLYTTGDDIKGAGASVKEILSDKILISRNGAIESLEFSKKIAGTRTSRSRGTSSASDDSSYPSIYDDPGYAGGTTTSLNDLQTGSGGSSNGSSYTSNSGLPKDYLQQSSRKPQSPNGQARPIKKPNFSGLDRALKKLDQT